MKTRDASPEPARISEASTSLRSKDTKEADTGAATTCVIDVWWKNLCDVTEHGYCGCYEETMVVGDEFSAEFSASSCGYKDAESKVILWNAKSSAIVTIKDSKTGIAYNLGRTMTRFIMGADNVPDVPTTGFFKKHQETITALAHQLIRGEDDGRYTLGGKSHQAVAFHPRTADPDNRKTYASMFAAQRLG